VTRLPLAPLLEHAPEAWRENAACKPYPVEWFINEVNTDTAKGVCDRCPVRMPCQRAGIDGHERGVWGGLDDADRHRIRRKR
jgi:WhiB family redox-sensing transcriptional regulator